MAVLDGELGTQSIGPLSPPGEVNRWTETHSNFGGDSQSGVEVQNSTALHLQHNGSVSKLRPFLEASVVCLRHLGSACNPHIEYN